MLSNQYTSLHQQRHSCPTAMGVGGQPWGEGGERGGSHGARGPDLKEKAWLVDCCV